MLSPYSTYTGHIHPVKSPERPSNQPTNYCPIPQRLLADLHDTPLAIGLYALVGRLYLVHQAPIPLSRTDVLRYDPTLKAGAVKRAFDRLVNGGWLVEAVQERCRKQRYTPTWGRVKGTLQPWQIGQPCFARPRHIARLPLDRSLLDVCMGKLTPHPTQPATITRYVTTPALSLADVGCYALTMADIPHETPNLRWLGLVRDGRALAVASEQRLLAIISQRPLVLDDAIERDTELTISGTRRLGLDPQPQAAGDNCTQPLFFVPPGLIGSLIGPSIGSLIGHGTGEMPASSASEREETKLDSHSSGIAWESLDSEDSAIPPPPPPASLTASGGGKKPDQQEERQSARRARRSESQQSKNVPEVPGTDATRLLMTINVRPEQLIELAEMPIAIVETAITSAKARDGIRDLAGWVVSALRAHRDHGWKIAPPSPRPDPPEALRLAFARYAAEQEAERHAGLPNDRPWFAPLAPIALDAPGALLRLWNEVQAAIKSQTSRAEFDAWIRRAQLHSVEHGVATIQAPNALIKQAIEDRYLGALRELLAMYAGQALDLRVILNPSAPVQTSTAQDEPAGCTSPAESFDSSQPPTRDSQPPSWIAAERWVVLPAMLRAALLGSTIVDREIQAASPYLSRLLQTRYAREVAELIA